MKQEGLPRWLSGKESVCNAGDAGDANSILVSRRSPGGEMAMHSNILAWGIPWTEEPNGLAVHGTAKSKTRLRDQACNMKWDILISIIY